MRVENLSDLVNRRMREKGISRAELSRRVGVNPVTIDRVRSGGIKRPQKLRPWATALEVDISEVVAAVNHSQGNSLAPEINNVGIARSPGRMIPTWPELSLAASHWVESAEVGEVDQAVLQETRRAGVFIVPINGDCMEPEWPDGCSVMFELLQNGEDYEAGLDYYIQGPDGATFKRCIEVTDDVIVIGNIHGRKRQWTIAREDISRSAKAIAEIRFHNRR